MKDALDLIIFDLDGTLVEFHHDYLFDQTHKILANLDHPPVERETLEHHFALFDYFAFVEHELDTFVKHFWDAFDWNNFPQSKPFPETNSVLAQLKQHGYGLTIATARLDDELSIRSDLAHTGILSFIETVHARRNANVDWRDKSETILRACQTHGVDPKRAAMIGDIPADIESAKSVGLGLSIAVASGGIRREVLLKSEPDLLLDSLAQVPNILITPRP